MALLFLEGFDHYTATTDLVLGKWSGAQAAGQSLVTGRLGGQAYRTTNSTSTQLVKNPWGTAIATVVFGCAIKTSLAATVGITFTDAGTDQFTILVNTNGTVGIRRGGYLSTVIATSASALVFANVWTYLEFKVTAHNSTGAYEIRVNGTNILSATGADTCATANNSVSGFYFVNGSTTQTDWDDIYLFDNNGTTNNDFVGDCRVETLWPNAADSAQFTSDNGSANYTRAGETLYDGDTSFVYSDTAGHKDVYALSDVAASAVTVYGVQVTCAHRKTDTGARTVQTVVNSNGTESLGTAVAPGTSYAMTSSCYDRNPDGTVAWTPTTVNALKAGFKIAT